MVKTVIDVPMIIELTVDSTHCLEPNIGLQYPSKAVEVDVFDAGVVFNLFQVLSHVRCHHLILPTYPTQVSVRVHFMRKKREPVRF